MRDGSVCDFPASSAEETVGAVFEALEGRLLLAVEPMFATALPDRFVITPGGGGLTVGVDGFDADGDKLTITATCADANIVISQPTITRFARLHFVGADGTTPVAGDGDIVVALFDGLSKTATDRFVTLATRRVLPNGRTTTTGDPFYTDVLVHRIIDYFMIQTGDAANGDGTGGSPLGDFKDVFDPVLSFAGRGVLAMANSGADTNDSQFFITEAPTTWLNQAHMIFGQIISGWDVLAALSETPVDADDAPWEHIYLDHVEIFQSKQDTAFTFSAKSGFDTEAQVTITLNDGHGNTVSKVITLKDSRDVTDTAAVTLPDTDITVRPGQTATFQPTITNATSPWLHVYEGAGAQVTMDPDTYEISITIPADYPYAQFTVGVAAENAGAPYDNVMPAIRTFDVWVTGDSPIVTILNAYPTVFPGQTYSFTPTILDELGANLDVWVETYDPALQYTVSVDPDTHLVTVTLPAGFDVPSFPVRVLAKEAGFDHPKPGYGIFYVYAAGSSPVITQVPDPALVRPGQTYQFTPSITDDGPRSLVLGIQASRSDVKVSLDPVTKQVTIVTPAGLTGMFSVTISAVEIGFKNRAPTTKTFYVFCQETYDPPALGRVATSTNGQANGTFQLGDYLYVANGYGGLQIFDVTNPAAPVLRSTQAASYDFWDVHVVNTLRGGNPATIAFVTDLFYGVAVYDVTNPSTVTKITTLASQDATVSIHAMGNLLFQCDWTKGLKVYDISDVSNIQLKDTVTAITAGYSVGWASAVTAHGNHAYLLDANGYLFVLDISNPADVKFVSGFGTAGLPWDIVFQDDTVYVIDQYTGLIAVDVHDPARPTLLGYTRVASMPWAKVAVSGNLAVTSHGSGFTMTDVSDPTKMVTQYEFAGVSWGGGASFLGGRLALPFDSGGVAILDADDLTRSMRVTGTRTFDFANGRSVTVRVSGPGGARVYLDPNDPEVISLLEIVGSTSRTSVTLTTRNGDARIADITTSGDLKSLVGKTTDLLGDLTVRGMAGQIVLDDLADGRLIEINAAGGAVGPRDKVTLVFDRVADTSIDTHGVPITSLTVTEWLDLGAPADVILAPWIGRIVTRGERGNDLVNGDFAATLTLDGTGVASNRYVLGSATIAGTVLGGTWNVVGNVGTVRVGGASAAWTLSAAGYVNSLDGRNADQALAGTITADYFKRISVRGDLTAAIHAVASYGSRNTSIGSLTAGSVKDVSLDLGGGIGSITVTEWVNTDGLADEVRAAWIGRLTTKGQRANARLGLDYLAGDFEANLTVTGAGVARGYALGGARIAGSLAGVGDAIAWTLTGGAEAVAVSGEVNNWAGHADAMRSFYAGAVRNASLAVDGALGSVRAYCWEAGSLEANTLGSLYVTGYRGNARLGIDPVDGNFGADLTVHGQCLPPRRTALGWAKIANNLTGSTWRIESGPMGALTVYGLVENSTVRCAGDIASLTLGATSGSDFLAGITADAAPEDVTADQLDALASIRSVTIRGVRGADPASRFITDSDFLAGTFGSMSLLNVEDAGEYRFFVACESSIRSIRQRDTADPRNAAKNWSWRPGQDYPGFWDGALPIHAVG